MTHKWLYNQICPQCTINK